MANETKTTYTSVLYWPKEVSLLNGDNSSKDTHIDEASAIAVCETLIREGLGCDGQHFPVKAKALSNDKVIFEWTKEDGIITKEKEPFSFMDAYYKSIGLNIVRPK